MANLATEGEVEGVRLRIPRQVMRSMPYDDWLHLHNLIRREAIDHRATATACEIYTAADCSLATFVRDLLHAYNADAKRP